MKKKLLVFLVIVLAAAVVTVFACNYRNYDKHTFQFLSGGFSWDMTKDDAVAYIEENQVQSWREIEIEDDMVSDGWYYFDFDGEGELYRVRINMGGDATIIYTLEEWFGEPDKVKTTPVWLELLLLVWPDGGEEDRGLLVYAQRYLLPLVQSGGVTEYAGPPEEILGVFSLHRHSYGVK